MTSLGSSSSPAGPKAYSGTYSRRARRAAAMGSDIQEVVGLLGGGQLGRMLCEAAGPLGIEIAVLDAEDAPAKKALHNNLHVTGSFQDPAKIKELAAQSDVLTVETEHVDTLVLEDIETNGVKITLPDGTTTMHKPRVHPSWKTLRLIQDKYLQKEHLREKAIPIAEQMAIESGDAAPTSLEEAAQKFGFPFMLKARKGSYDGRGNFTVTSADDFDAAIDALGKQGLYAEKWAPFQKELAVMVIRTEDNDGNLKSCVPYPAVETVHQESICTTTYMPPRHVSEDVREKAKVLACDVVSTLWGRGVFAVEMFLLEDDSLIVNEIAPRPHNSGHYTIETHPYMSQFKAQLCSVLDLPIPEKLGSDSPAAIMVNILGGAAPTSHYAVTRFAWQNPQEGMQTFIHMYGKESKRGRKIGHITLTGSSSIYDLEKLAQRLLDLVGKMRVECLEASREQLRSQGKSDARATGEGASANEVPSEEATQPLVLVTMGSESDLPVLKAGLDILRRFRVPFIKRVTSAHRMPDTMMRVAEEAVKIGIKVIIAAAGGAAHLPGMVSSKTPLPVIGVPVKASHLEGMDSLLSIVQMPRGVPTATVGINNSTNAALLAIRILGVSMPRFQQQMVAYQQQMEEAAGQTDDKMCTLDHDEYLAQMK